MSGWLRRGPSGIVGTNITDAKETAASLLEDHAAGKLHACEKVMPGLHLSLLPSCGACEECAAMQSGLDTLLPTLAPDLQIVDADAWRRIDAWETKHARANAPRLKLTDKSQMLEAARK